MMAFPDTPLDLRVNAQIGGERVDLSSRLLDVPARIQRGGRDGAVPAASARITLNNDDAALTPLNPVSPYYPHIRRGLILDAAIRHAYDDYTRAGTGWGTAPSGQVWLDSGGTVPADYPTNGAKGLHVHPTTNVLHYSSVDTGVLNHRVRTIANLSQGTVTGANASTWLLGRMTDIANYYALVINYTPAGDITMGLFKRVLGTLSTVAAPFTTHAGYSGLLAATQLGLELYIEDDRLHGKMWDYTNYDEPVGWQIVGEDDSHTAGTRVGIADRREAGNTNPNLAFAYDSFLADSPQFCGPVGSYRPTIVPTTDGFVSAMQIEAAGVMRGLEQGAKPLRPPLDEAVLASNPIAYWPLSDGEDAGQAASGLPGGTPLTVRRGVIDFIADGPPGAGGAARVTQTTTSTAYGTVPRTAASAARWQIAAWVRGAPTDTTYNETKAVDVAVTAAANPTWRILLISPQQGGSPASRVQFIYLNPDGVVIDGLFDTGQVYPGILDSRWHLVQVTLEQSGANTVGELYLDGTLIDTGTFAGVTLGAPTAVSALSAATDDVAFVEISGIAIWDTDVLVSGLYQAGLAHVDEPAGRRIERLCQQRGVPFRAIGDLDDTQPMGPQPADTWPALVRDAAAADVGILFEPAEMPGLAYRTRVARYAPASALTVDLATYNTTAGTSARVLMPVYDDQGLRNDVEASRPDGSSARVVDQQHIDLHGRYDAEIEVNVANDGLLPDMAGWAVHMGTVDQLRSPVLPVDLAANPGLIPAWLRCDIGVGVRRVNAPGAHIPGGVIDQVIDGYTATIGPRSWTVDINGSPAEPWRVRTYAAAPSPAGPKYDSQGTTLAAGITAGQTAITFRTIYPESMWTTDPAEMPISVLVGGERMTVTAIAAPVGQDQAVTVVRAVNGVSKSHAAGAVVALAEPIYYGI
jgi:hypothetical protein